MRIRPLSVLTVLGVLLVTTVPGAQAALAGTSVGVAPSPNGYVMVGVPTQIAASGFKGVAKVYRFDAGSKKWSMLGSVRGGVALPYTFPESGPIRIKVVPSRGSAKTAVVGVYRRIPVPAEPGSFGTTVLESNAEYFDVQTASAADRCVLVDVGLSSKGTQAISLRIQSTGAPESTLTVNPGTANAAINVPISGDTVLTPDFTGHSSWGSTMGVVWTCLQRKA